MMLGFVLKKVEPQLELPIVERFEIDHGQSIGRGLQRSQHRRFVVWSLQAAREPSPGACLNRGGVAFAGSHHAPELARHPV